MGIRGSDKPLAEGLKSEAFPEPGVGSLKPASNGISLLNVCRSPGPGSDTSQRPARAPTMADRTTTATVSAVRLGIDVRAAFGLCTESAGSDDGGIALFLSNLGAYRQAQQSRQKPTKSLPDRAKKKPLSETFNRAFSSDLRSPIPRSPISDPRLS